MNATIDFRAIAAAALARAETLVPSWLPEGKREGHEYTALNPRRPDAHIGSFKINLTTGQWGDFATDDRGGDLVSLFAYLGNLKQTDAARQLAEALAIAIPPATGGTRRAPRAATQPSPTGAASHAIGGNLVSTYPSPTGAASQPSTAGGSPAQPAATPPPLSAIPRHAQDKRPVAHRRHGKPTKTWVYNNAQGEPIAYVCRFDPPGVRKEYCPLTWNVTTSTWEWKAPPPPRPLYGLERLAARPAALVIVTEGEKAADACQALCPEAVVITSMNGAQAAAKSDWRPLAGRSVRLWPDHDPEGAKYADTVRKLARQAGALRIETLDLFSLAKLPGTATPRELPEKWDAADALADGWTPETFARAAVWSVVPGAAPRKASAAEQATMAKGTPTGNSNASKADGSNDHPVANHLSIDQASFGNSVPETADPATKGAAEPLPKPEVARPSYVVHPDWTGFGKPGLYWHTEKIRGETKEKIDTWICSPLWADAVTASEKESDFGLLLRFTNANGNEREWSMPMRLLRGSGEELRGELLDLGVRIDPACHKQLNGYLMSRLPERRVLAATATGWHADGSVFVMPETTLGEGEVRYQSETASHDEFAVTGSLSGWQQEIAARCVGNPALAFAVAAALGGPFLHLIKRPGGGFHFVADSSTGKTSLLTIAASCWGGAGFIRTWQATAAGLEGIAAAVTDTALVLDEISEADPRTIGSIVYQLGNGTGRTRGERTGGARAVQRWRVILLSSGERSLAVTMAEGGKAPKAGMEIRLLDIPCTRAAGVFDCIHDAPDARAFSDTLRTAAARHHGHAGPELVRAIIAHRAVDFGGEHARILHLPAFAHDNALEGRAAHAFALVAMAGELATEWGILPWPEGTAIEAAAWAYHAWRQGRPRNENESTQILRSVSDFLTRHGDSRFSNIASDGNIHLPPIRDRAGWWRDTEHTRVYLFTPEGLREAAAGFDFRRALKALDSAGWIIDRDPGKSAKKVKVQGRAIALYHVAVPEGDD